MWQTTGMTTTVEAPSPIFEIAAEHATADVPIVAPEATVDDVRRSLAGRRFTSARDLAVCAPGRRLVGLVRIEELLAATGDGTVAEIMDPDPPSVGPGVDQEIAAWAMVGHGEASLAVVDDDGVFQGLIPPTEMLSVLLREHDEDLARLGGYLHDTSVARLASEEPVARRLLHRLPWLLVGLAGAFVTALVLGGFESRLEADVELAFFVPAIVYLAGAIGTQTETLIVRGLSVGVSLRSIVRGELLTGGIVGVVLAAVFLPFALVIWGQLDLAVVVAVAILASGATATVVGMGLPWLLVALGRDPAFGSGPLVTIVQDLISILVYLGLAVAIL